MPHFPLPRRRPVRLVLASAVTSALVGTLVVTAFAPAASAAPSPTTKRTVARADSAVVTAGRSVTVKVLANDTTTGAKSKAKVRIVTKSPRLKTVVTKSGRIKVTPRASTKPGRYAVTYKVTSKGRAAKAKLRVRVKAKPAVAVPQPEASDPGTTGPVGPDPTGPTGSEGEPLAVVLDSLSVVPEVGDGYDRTLWKHWNAGAVPADGCDTRSEVLIGEAVVPVAAGTKCAITKANSGGGSWYSWYDGVTETNPSAFDIDHMVPLAEAHHSGGWAWDATTREAYANDLGDPRSLVAVSASSNRSKSDRDPAEWMPPLQRCRYASEWVAVKARWELAVDETERSALATIAAQECATTTVVVIRR